MRYAIYILFVLFCCSCRTSKSTDRSISDHQDIKKGSTSSRIDSSRIEMEGKSSVSTNIDIKGYIRTVNYNDSGRIQSIQEQWWNNGSSQLSESSGRSGDVSVSSENTQTNEDSTKLTTEDIKTKVDTDSRIIQGKDWFWIIIVVAGIIALIIYLIKKKVW